MSKLKNTSFEQIWKEFIIPLEGKTLYTLDQNKPNKIIKVTSKGVIRKSSEGRNSTVKIEIIRWAIERLFSTSKLERIEIENEFGKRCSSIIFAIFDRIPYFELISKHPLIFKLKESKNEEKIYASALNLLKQLIETPSFSTEENKTAEIIFDFLAAQGLNPKRFKNNVWAQSSNYDAAKPTLLLNSHHDTVQPSPAYTRDPFGATIEDGKLYGLGSNDAGGSVVSLLYTFFILAKEDLPYNLVVAITAEEERVSINGISALLPELPKIDFAIVGEPTQMNAAIAERGLMVLDCLSKGISGHAARDEGDNALYHAIDDIQWFRTYRFPKVSPLMGEVKMTATQIQAGTQHNVIPAECSFVVDVRPTDCYTNEEIVEVVRQHVKCEVKPRSTSLLASALGESHCLIKTAKHLGMTCYISPTTSDITRIPVPALKLGPGDSARSHTADEFIYVAEIQQGIDGYIRFLKTLEVI